MSQLSASTVSGIDVVLVHPFDPRGKKVGGVETFLRDYIALHPEDLSLTLIGADEVGDLEIGKPTKIEVFGRTIEFIPAINVVPEDTSQYASKLSKSLTFRFLLAALRMAPQMRRRARKKKYTLDMRRSEYAILADAYGVQSVHMLHDGMTKEKQMSSLLKRYWWIKNITEWYAIRRSEKFYCVNADLTQSLKEKFPTRKSKIDTLTTWANTNIYAPAPFVFDGDIVDIIYAGRMDLFKRPDIMFTVINELQKRTGRVRFNYAGDGDVEQFPEFSAIRGITVRHGVMAGPELAKLMHRCQMGILTSDFEGMPRFVMELLSSGRPAVCLHLPQLEDVIRDGETGFLIERGSDQIEKQAARMLEIYDLARGGALEPQTIRAAVEPYSPQSLLGKIWNDHRRMHGLAVPVG